MTDPRVTKLAQVLVHYSVEIKPKQQVMIRTNPLAEELTLAVYEEVVKSGAYPLVLNETPGTQEIFFKFADEDQLDHISPVVKMVMETFDASITLWSDYNTRRFSGADNAKMARARHASAPIMRTAMRRTATGEFRWVVTVYPTHAMAQEADMSLDDYREFVFRAGLLHEDDPVSLWKAEGLKQQKLIQWLKNRDQAVIKGSNADIVLSIKDRTFIECSGKANFPDGEIFTGPVEDSVNGWIRFKYPALFAGQEITDIELWFENGRVIKEKASKNQELLTSALNTDAGSRFLGEWGIGTHYGIQRFTKNMLFDEKMGGTIHFAVGAGYPESGSKNESGLHWDMLCDMSDAEITLDGDLFYKNGRTVIQ
ncbi:MAG: aminopeptidase [Chloroflexi bacterium]|nr:aminopeptidase [Chloroflexota bacterium]